MSNSFASDLYNLSSLLSVLSPSTVFFSHLFAVCELCSTNGKTPAEVNRGLTISRLSRPRKTLCVRIRYDSPARWLARWDTTPARR